MTVSCNAALFCNGTRPGRNAPPAHLVIDDVADPPPIAQVERFLRDHMPIPTRRLAVFKRADMAIPAWLGEVITHHLNRLQISTLTVTKNGARWGRNVLATLKRSPRWATTANEPWRGLPAFVVGAGSSLDTNGHLLREAARRGPIVAVNSSAGCCLHHGVTPDLIVCCEAVPLPGHLAPFAGKTVIALDAISAPESWDAAGPDAVAFMLHEPYLVPYALQLGVMPLHYSASSMTAAISLAMLWGAGPIVLVGQNNGVTGGELHQHTEACGTTCSTYRTEALVYGQGSPFAGQRATVGPWCQACEQSRVGNRDAVKCDACGSGLSPGVLIYEGGGKHPYAAHCVLRDSWGGGDPTPSDHTFDPVVTWEEGAARRNVVINASEGGVSLRGCFENRLEDVLAMYEPKERAPIVFEPAPDTAPVLSRIGRDALAVIASGATSLAPDFADFDLLHMWAVPAMIGARVNDRKRAVAEAVQVGAREILEALSAT